MNQPSGTLTPMHARGSRQAFLRGTAAAIAGAASLSGRPAEAAYSPVIIGKDKWLFPFWEPVDDPQDAQIQQQLDLIVKARDLFASKHISLIYLAVPMKARFYIDKLPATNPMSAGVKSRYARLMQWVAERKLMTVDLVKPLTPVGSVAGQTWFFQTDQHWTEWSAEAAATAVADFIGNNVKLPAATGAGATLDPWISYRRMGDLTALLPASQQAQFGLQTYVVRQAYGDDMKLQNQTTGNDLDVPDPAIRLIDGSLFRPNWGFPQKISNVLNRPVSLTWLRGDTGPWMTMLNFVESAQFKSNPPTLVVWGISEGEVMHGPMSPQWFFKTALMTPQQWLSRMTAAVKALS